MMVSGQEIEGESLMLLFQRIRARSKALIVGLAPEGTVVRCMLDASPTTGYLAHTTWFFEEFVLAVFLTGYCPGWVPSASTTENS